MSKPAADNALTEARAAFRQSLENLTAARARAAAYRNRIGEVAAKARALRAQHGAAIAAAIAALDQFIAGEIDEDQAARADTEVENIARRIAEMDALAAKIGERPDPDLSNLYRARDDSRQWLSLAAIEDCIGKPIADLTAALPGAFHAWLFARPDAVQWQGSHAEHERLWPVFIASITPACPDKPTLAAARAELVNRVPEVG